MSDASLTKRDPWQPLREVTSARIALGRVGASLPTRPWLEFKLAHAQARDAVHNRLDLGKLNTDLASLGHSSVVVETAVPDRATYLRRPDLGGRLSDAARVGLEELAAGVPAVGPMEKPDLVILLSDGLSALALQEHAAPLLAQLLPKLAEDDWAVAPLVIAPLARVALQDEVGELLGARLALILLGERPGLGAPDSLGAYLVYEPGRERTNADRNCVSNIRVAGLAPEPAAEAIAYLLRRALGQKRSGIALKDDRRVIEAGDETAETAETAETD